MIQHLDSSGLEQNQVIIAANGKEETRELVSCGKIIPGQTIRIVNPEEHTLCPPEKIGEIWVSGPNVAGGYWNKPLETEVTFGARLSSGGEGPFLRTGDLGFLHGGELYITGRLKDLIISDGKNHYAHDIERTVESSHPAIRLAGCAVFSINNAEKEDIVVIAEIEHKLVVKAAEAIQSIRKAVAQHHDLHFSDIRLTDPGGIPRTTSGKIRRFLCKTYYLAGAFNEISLT